AVGVTDLEIAQRPAPRSSPAIVAVPTSPYYVVAWLERRGGDVGLYVGLIHESGKIVTKSGYFIPSLGTSAFPSVGPILVSDGNETQMLVWCDGTNVRGRVLRFVSPADLTTAGPEFTIASGLGVVRDLRGASGRFGPLGDIGSRVIVVR